MINPFGRRRMKDETGHTPERKRNSSIMPFIGSIFISPITPKGWFEFYRSFTIPYIYFAGFYYYRVFSETKKQDKLIQEIRDNNKAESN